MGKNKNKKNKQLAQSPVISQATPLSSPAIVPDSPLQVPSVINEDSPIESVVVRVDGDNFESIDKQAAQAVRKKEQEFLALLEEQKTKIQEARQDLEILLDKKEQALAELNKEKEIHAELKAKLEQQNSEEKKEEEDNEEEKVDEVKGEKQPWYKRLMRFFIYK